MTFANDYDRTLCALDDRIPDGGFRLQATRRTHRDEPHKLAQPGATPGPAPNSHCPGERGTVAPVEGETVDFSVSPQRRDNRGQAICIWCVWERKLAGELFAVRVNGDAYLQPCARHSSREVHASQSPQPAAGAVMERSGAGPSCPESEGRHA